MSSVILDEPVAKTDSHKPALSDKSNAKAKKDPRLDRIFASFDRANLRWNNLDHTIVWWMVAMHVGCLVAPFYFSFQGLITAVVLHWATCSLGICLGYHRYLSHRSMKLKSPAEFFVLLCGVLSGEGTPLRWSAVHRVHHQRSDHFGDPHSPRHGAFWAHLFWTFVKHKKDDQDVLYKRYVPDLVNRPLMQFFERTFVFWLIGSGVVLYAIGGLSLLLWGLCVRMVFAYHSTWLINSATHIWGYRNYDTTDDSRNIWWVALFAYGEGWHNNHHAHPSIAPAGHRWWEVDMTWWAIKFLRFTGLATDVKDKIPEKTSRKAEEEQEVPAATA